jgi:hypothetical protein
MVRNSELKAESGPNAAGTTLLSMTRLDDYLSAFLVVANAGVEYMATQVRTLSRPQTLRAR